MSIALMTAAWKARLPAGKKMVLLALCDNANDRGECYPSIPMIAEKCSMGIRTVQTHIADLERDEWVARDSRAGRSNLYTISTSKLTDTPADVAPRRICTPQISHPTPADFAPQPPQISHPTPAESAPITVNEPSKEPKKKKTKGADAPLAELPEWVPVAEWAAYVEMRKRIRAPLTDHAKALELRELAKLRNQGHDPAAVLNKSVQKSWRGLFPLKDLPSTGPQRPSAHGGFERIDYSAGINPDGSF